MKRIARLGGTRGEASENSRGCCQGPAIRALSSTFMEHSFSAHIAVRMRMLRYAHSRLSRSFGSARENCGKGRALTYRGEALFGGSKKLRTSSAQSQARCSSAYF